MDTLLSLHPYISLNKCSLKAGKFTRASTLFLRMKSSSAFSTSSFPSNVAQSSPAAPFSTDSHSQPVDVSQDSLVLEPIRETGVDVLLVFAPGALTPASDYIPLCKEIQSSSQLKLWVAIINPPNNIISTEITEGSFDGIIQRVKSLGFQPGRLAMDNVFLAGHSWGAWTARTVALRRAQAFIQLGSCFHTNPDNLAQYPKPVLTMSGELDGQITLAAIAKHAGEIAKFEPEMESFNTYAVKPVIIIPGMNHAQFSHGIPNKARGDLDAEISLAEARAKAGNFISAFISVHVTYPFGPSNKWKEMEDIKKLQQAVEKTHDMCKAYWVAIEEQENVSNVKRYQLELLDGIPKQVEEHNIVVVNHDFKDNFIYSKPWIEKESSAIKIFNITYLNPYGKYDLVKNLWLKMKSREAILAELGSEPSQLTELERVAAKFNERTFTEALDMVSVEAREKYLQRGRKLRIVDDLIITDSALKWIESDVKMTAAADGLVDVQSPVLISPATGMVPRFAGMHYMKLLTTAGAMQWILIDCYRESI